MSEHEPPPAPAEELDLEAAERYWRERQASDDGNIALSEADFHIRLEESRGVLAILREARRGRAARKALGELVEAGRGIVKQIADAHAGCAKWRGLCDSSCGVVFEPDIDALRAALAKLESQW